MVPDEVLDALARAGDPDAPIAAGAVPLPPEPGPGLLPEWYMPAVGRRRVGRWAKLTALVLTGALLLIEAVGLCSTYGQLPLH